MATATCNTITEMPTRLLSIKQTADEFGGAVWYWRTLVWDGQIPHIRAGRKIYLDEGDIRQHIAKSKQQNGQ